MHKKGISLNSLKNFCLRVPIKFVGEHFCVSKEFWYRKFPSKGGGKLHGFVENFLSHRTEKPSPGNHFVFQKISGREKIFMDKRLGGGGITIFRRKVFVSLYQNISLENTLVFQKNFFNRIFSSIGGGHHAFAEFFFVSQDRNEKRCKGTLLFFLFSRKFLVSKNFMDKRGHVTIFSRNFYVSQCRKIS